MPRIIFITGIDTNCGKTLTACALSTWFHEQGNTVKYLKPFQTGQPHTWDGETLKKWGNVSHHPHPYFWTHTHPGAPYECIRYFNANPIQFKSLETWLNAEAFNAKEDVVLLEGCGGLLVPLSHEHTFLHFLDRIPSLEVLVVSHLKLGAINHTLHTLKTIHTLSNPFLGVCYFGDGNERNIQMISDLSNTPTFGRVTLQSGIPKFVR